MLRMWRNSEDAGVVRKIAENNFKVLGKHLSQNMLCLSTTERESLSSDYLSKGLRVYDTTLNNWFVYNGIDWEEAEKAYVLEFLSDDWNYLGIGGYLYNIRIPFSTHLIKNPSVQSFIKYGNGYESVIDSVVVAEDYSVVLWSDMPYEGKVVIK